MAKPHRFARHWCAFPGGVERAVVEDYPDADTIGFLVDSGEGRYDYMRARVRDLLCDERFTPNGIAATDMARTILPLGAQVVLVRTKDDSSFDRWPSDILYLDGGRYRSYAAEMVAAGFGTWRDQAPPRTVDRVLAEVRARFAGVLPEVAA